MSRFVEFTTRGGKKVWLNPDCCVSLSDALMDVDQCVCVMGADGEIPYYVMGTVPEVLAKLQGAPEPQPAPAADDIAGWWVNGVRVMWVIGVLPNGQIACLWDNGRYTTHDDKDFLATWTRDPNRKGWEG